MPFFIAKNANLKFVSLFIMTVAEIYELVNYIANKNKAGNAYNIDRYNQTIEGLDPDFFKRKIEEFEL